MGENTISDEKQCEYEWEKWFIAENELLLHNQLLRSFLLEKENCFLLNQSIRNPTFDSNQALNQAFQDHFAEVRLISQLSNELRRHAIRYDQKMNAYRKRHAFILDQPLHNETNTSMIDMMMDVQHAPVDEAVLENNQHLEEVIENPTLYFAIHSLTPRQKQILTASYLFNLTDSEIADKEGVSQQTISKTRNKALRNLKKRLRTEEENHE